jgi:hypothetical protein
MSRSLSVVYVNCTATSKLNSFHGNKAYNKRPLGRPRRRWVHNIKMDLTEIGWDGKDWIDLAQDRDKGRTLVNTAMNRRVA